MSKDNVSLPLLLKELRLSGMLAVFEDLAQRAEHEGWDVTKYLATLCEHEIDQKQQNRIAKYKKEAHLPIGKSLDAFDQSHLKGVKWGQVEALCEQPDWLKKAHNVLLFGPSGVGKTHLAAAIGHSLVLQGQRVLFSSTTALVQRLRQAHKGLFLMQEIMKLDRYQLLILDDLGYVRKDEEDTHVLFELITHRYEHRSLLLTSNQPFSQWDQVFKDQAMTIAAVDRLVHHGMIFELTGESYRRRQALASHTNQGESAMT